MRGGAYALARAQRPRGAGHRPRAHSRAPTPPASTMPQSALEVAIDRIPRDTGVRAAGDAGGDGVDRQDRGAVVGEDDALDEQDATGGGERELLGNPGAPLFLDPQHLHTESLVGRLDRLRHAQVDVKLAPLTRSLPWFTKVPEPCTRRTTPSFSRLWSASRTVARAGGQLVARSVCFADGAPVKLARSRHGAPPPRACTSSRAWLSDLVVRHPVKATSEGARARSGAHPEALQDELVDQAVRGQCLGREPVRCPAKSVMRPPPPRPRPRRRDVARAGPARHRLGGAGRDKGVAPEVAVRSLPPHVRQQRLERRGHP